MKSVFSKIFSDIYDLQNREGFSDIDAALSVHQLIRGEEPTLKQDEIYRLAWFGYIRAVARDEVGIVTSAMQWDMIESGAMSLKEVEDDYLGIEVYSPAYVRPDERLGLFWESAANAIIEIGRYSGADLRILVETPICDFRGELGEVDQFSQQVPSWSDASEDAKSLLLQGHLIDHFATPQTEEEFLFRAQQLHELGGVEEQFELLDAVAGVSLRAPVVHVVKARAYARSGDVDAAIDLLGQTDFGQADTTMRDIALDAAYEFKALGLYPEAIDLLTNMSQSLPNDTVLYELAHTESIVGQNESALGHIRHALDLAPERALIHELHGFILVGLDRKDEALTAYDRAIELDDYSTVALNNRGEIFLERDDVERALQDFDAVLSIEEKLITRVNRSDAYLALQRYDDAIAETRLVLQQQPDQPRALLTRGTAFEATACFEGAMSAYVKLLRTSFVVDEFTEQASAHLKRLGYKGPIETPWPAGAFQIAQSESLDPATLQTVLSYSREIEYRISQNLLQDALELCNVFVDMFEDPQSAPPQPWSLRSRTYYWAQMFEEALADARVAIDLAPTSEMGYASANEAFVGLGQFEDALAMCDKVCELEPNRPESWFARGFALERLERFEDALSSNQKALALDPGYEDALYNSARLLAELERFDESEATYKTLLSINPNDTEAMVNLGAGLLFQTKVDQALPYFERATDIRPDYTFAYQKLSLTRADQKKAIVDYAIAVGLAGGEEYVPGEYFGALVATGSALEAEGARPDPTYLEERLNALDGIGASDASLSALAYLEPLLGDQISFWLRCKELAESLYTDEGDELATTYQQKINTIDPDHPLVQLQLGIDSYDDAFARLTAFENVLIRLDELSDDKKADAFRALSSYAGDGEQHARSVAILKKSLSLHEAFLQSYDRPDEYTHNQLLFRLALKTDLAGNREESIAYYTTLIERDPSESTYFFNRACEYGMLGRTEEAVADLKQAISMNAKWIDDAQSDTYFDPVRDDDTFKALFQ